MENIYLNTNDVLSVDNRNGWVVLTDTTFKVDAFIAKMKSSVQGHQTPTNELFEQGISCEMLRPGANWQKGKFKIRLEFCPAKPESPLDDIRQAIKEAEILE